MQRISNRAFALMSGVCTAALASAGAQAQTSPAAAFIDNLEQRGVYLSGDKHNHTTCTDGAMSVDTVVNESLITYGLDWFAQTGHGGEGNRDCRFNDPEYDGANSGEGDYWENTVGLDAIGGDDEFSGGNGASAFFGRSAREMWRWQSLNEFAYPLQRNAGVLADKPAWLGIESNVPGHEHVSMAIIQRQVRPDGETYATGQFEYLWDRADEDTSGGDDNDFENPANNGVAKENGVTAGQAGHERSVRSVEWLRDNFGREAYYVPAHVERQGGFTTGTTGYNVEHFRDYYNAGLLDPTDPTGESIAFGAEMIAGHQFGNGGRGTYEADRPTAGFGTYGGAGAYSGAEVSQPGKDFEGNDLTNAALTVVRDELNALFDNRLTEPSGSDQYDQLDACNDCVDPAPAGIGTSPRARFVLGRPGVRTMWDALLGEGRKFFNFGSSDWHNRGIFGPFEPQSTLDPYPGEYNKLYAYAPGADGKFNQRSAQSIVNGMRTGNSFSTMGDLVDSFYFVICEGGRCATMGQTLDLQGDEDITWYIKLRDPAGANFSPYAFDNPSLLQIGMNVPMNEPVLSHVDVIRGDITGVIEPTDPAYTSNVSNPTTEIFARVDNLAGEFTVEGDYLVASGTIPAGSVTNDMYFRVRGTNMPVGTPNETDADGNPLLDDFSGLIPCTATGNGEDNAADDAVEALELTGDSSFRARNAVNATFDPAACPEHLPVDADGVKFLDADVEAWADLWFYANPIFLNAEEPGGESEPEKS